MIHKPCLTIAKIASLNKSYGTPCIPIAILTRLSVIVTLARKQSCSHVIYHLVCLVSELLVLIRVVKQEL